MEADTTFTSADGSDLRPEVSEYLKYQETGSLADSLSEATTKGKLSSSETKVNSEADINGTVEVSDKADEAEAPKEMTPEEKEKEKEKKRMRRYLVVQEIYETERGYVNDLQNLVRNFLDPLNSAYLAGVAHSVNKTGDTASAATIAQNTTFGNENGGWLTFDQKQSIVRNASHLLRLQKLFLKMIEDAVKTPADPESDPKPKDAKDPIAPNPSVLQIAKCFLMMMAKIEAVYVPFCSQHDNALATVAAIRKAHPNQYNAFQDECRAKMNTRLEVQDFLIKPVQRICKYPLLLKEVKKGTPEDFPGHAEITDALDKIKALVATINTKKKDLENDQKKNAIISRIVFGFPLGIRAITSIFKVPIDPDSKTIPSGQSGDTLASMFGALIKGGGVYSRDQGENDLPFATNISTETNYGGAFLFGDILLVLTAKKSSVYHLIHAIPIKRVVNVQDFPPGSSEIALEHSWRMTWQAPDDYRTYYASVDLGVRGDKEKESWLAELSKLIPADKIVLQSLSSPDSPTEKEKSVAEVSSEFEDSKASLEIQSDLKFTDVFTTESLVAGAKNAATVSAKAGRSISAQFSRPTTGDKPASAKRRASIKRPSSLFGGSESSDSPTSATSGVDKLAEMLKKTSTKDDGSSAPEGEATKKAESTNEEPSENNLKRSKSRRASLSNMAQSLKNMVKNKSTTNLAAAADSNGSQMSLNDDGSSKKWGSSIKAKILTVGKIKASLSNLSGKTGESTQDLTSGSDDTRKSNSSLAEGGEKKKGLMTSLVRTFSRRGKEKKPANSASSSSAPEKKDPAERNNSEQTLRDGKSEEPKPPAGTALGRRSNVRRSRASATGDETTDAQTASSAIHDKRISDSNFSYVPAPPSSAPDVGAVPEQPSKPRGSASSARIAAIRAKRASKVGKEGDNGEKTPVPPVSSQ